MDTYLDFEAPLKELMDQISQTERWKIVYYVQKLQGKLAAPAASDSTAVAPADSLQVK